MTLRRMVWAVCLCTLFAPIDTAQAASAEDAALNLGAQSSAIYEVLHHKVALPDAAKPEQGCFVVARGTTLRATLEASGLHERRWPCDSNVTSCAGRLGPGVHSFAREGNARTGEEGLRLIVRHLADVKDEHSVWWAERQGAFEQLTCGPRRPEAEVWPLFTDGTARVTYARQFSLQLPGEHVLPSKSAARVPLINPVVIDLRHAAPELKMKDASSQAVAANVCRPHSALPKPSPVASESSAIWHVSTQKRRLALTFDACSTYEVGRFNPAVIRALREHQIPATLFIGGHWAEMFPDALEELAYDPLFELGNHTYSHPHMRDLPPNLQAQELLWTQQLIYARTGKLPRFFRPPYGEVDDEMLSEVAKAGLVTVEYDLPAGDADVHVSAARLSNWVENQISPGSVVIMHMNRPGNHTAEALGDIAQQLRARGYSFCKMSALVDDVAEGCL